MLDALRNITAGRNKFVQQQADELEALVATAREERAAISAMLTALTKSNTPLAPLGKQLAQLTADAAKASARMDDISARLSSLDGRSKQLEEIDARIGALQASVHQAEQAAQHALGPDSELRKHREAVQQLSSQVLQTQAAVDILIKERAALDELRGALGESEREVKDATAHAAALKSELDHIRASATTLTQDYAKIGEASREAREDTSAALSSVTDLQKKLEPLRQLHELSQGTADRLASLNSLAEHVTRKTKALESQQQAVEHAVVQANRVSEMVWTMDAQIAKLSDSLKQAANAEETIRRIERLSTDTAEHMDGATKLNQDLQRQLAKLQKESTLQLESVRSELGSLSARKRDLDALDERVRALHASVAGAEDRVENVAVRGGTLLTLSQKADALAKQFEILLAQADDLAQKQLALEPLHERLAHVEDLSKKTAWHADTLKQSRQDLDALRTDVQGLYTSHADLVRLRDRLAADRHALEAFGERMGAMAARAPELDARMDGILGKLALVEDGTHKATRLHEEIAELDAQCNRVTSRVQFVEKLETRLDSLNAFSSDVDLKLQTQLARQSELDALKTSCDGVAVQMADAQHKLEGVRALQNRLVPLVAELNTLRSEIKAAEDRIGRLKHDDAFVATQQARFAELVEAGRVVASEVVERSRQMQALSEELARSAAVKDELLGELDRVQSRQREAVGQIQAADEQLARAEKMFKQLEQRRGQLAFAEKKLSGVETRMADVTLAADELERHIQAVAGREQVVHAIKAEVEHVHEISARSKADLAHVWDRRSEIASLRTSVDDLLSRIAETDERLVAIDARRKVVDEVQAKAHAISHLLEDVRINLETLGAQKTVIDHVAEKAGQLELMLQEARNALRTLQHERELAERIEQGILRLRAQTASPLAADEQKTGAA